MDNLEIYKKIKTLADQLQQSDSTYLRADLAFELKAYGIQGDSAEVARLAYEAYKYYRDDTNIATVFVSNNSRTTLVADYKLNASLQQGQRDEAMRMVQAELGSAQNALEKLRQQTDLNLNLALTQSAAKMADVVTGSRGVKEVRTQATTLFDRYTKMTEAYHYAEDSVRACIEDFTTLRTDIESTYRDYATRLIDIYGNGIKAVAPSLFDFGRVEWLDVDAMLRHIELEYGKIQDKCGALISEISDSFRASLETSLKAYRSAGNGNKSIGLAMAGLQMLGHYMAASERTNLLRADLTTLQTSVKHDATHIKADMARLLVIYKTLNDVVIPKANVYMRYARRLMDSDLNAMTDHLYNQPNVRPLEERRQTLMKQIKAIDAQINDHLANIDIYDSLIKDITATLVSKKASYLEAKRKKPSKPFFIATKSYYRNYAEWDAVCAPFIREYDNYQIDLKLDQEELATHREALAAQQAERAKVSAQIEAVSNDIRKQIVANADLKMKMLKHLRQMVSMLKLGREIMESKLDERLVRTVEITDYRDKPMLPADMEQGLTDFAHTLADQLHADRRTAILLLDDIAPADASGHTASYADEDLDMVAGKANEAVQQGMALFDSALHLKMLQLNGQLAAAAYDQELEKHATQFREYIAQIDNKSAYLREIFRRINLAQGEDERRQAMALLSDLSGYSLSENEFDDFVNGKRQIEL